MRRLVASAAFVAGIAALAVAPATLAITNGGPDGNGHPEVGALLAQQAFSDGSWEECTGTLVSPTVSLTAGRCGGGGARVAVTFDSSYSAPKGATYWGTSPAYPAYRKAVSAP